MKSFTLLCSLVIYLCAAFAQEEFEADCTTPTEMDGRCIVIDDCEKLKPLIRKSSEEREYLKQWHCGFEHKTPKVCCPLKIRKDQCITLSGEYGSCVAMDACPHIRNRLKPPVSKDNLEYAQRSRCGTPEDYNVCCETSKIIAVERTQDLTTNNGDTIGEDKILATCDPKALLPDQKHKCCGMDSSSGNKIIGGVATAIDAYPWLAIIEYSRPYLCGASLISSRYVLTAAHCLVTNNRKTRGAESVRLGEYNTTNPGADCVEAEGGGVDCTKGDISIKIESYLVHPQYSTGKNLYNDNDIALIRLEKEAPYNEFIRPICLPLEDITKSPPTDLRLFVSGWGAIDERRTSDVKLEIDLPLIDKTVCDQKYSRQQVSILGPNQICAGGEANKDSCKGDSGGPMSYSRDGVQEIVGIISFGIIQCGSEGKPSVYTKVYDYLEWIRSNVKP